MLNYSTAPAAAAASTSASASDEAQNTNTSGSCTMGSSSPNSQTGKLPRLSAFLLASSSSSISLSPSPKAEVDSDGFSDQASNSPNAKANAWRSETGTQLVIDTELATPFTSAMKQTVPVDSALRCLYPGKRCDNMRTVKRGGGLHRLCSFHRARANRNQRGVDERRRRQRQARAEQDNQVKAEVDAQVKVSVPTISTPTLPPLFALIRPQTLESMATPPPDANSTSPLRQAMEAMPMPSMAPDDRWSPTAVATRPATTAATPVPLELRCLYTGKRCENMRTLKRGGGLHRLCAFHRMRANVNQWRVDERRRLRREQERVNARQLLHLQPHRPDLRLRSNSASDDDSMAR